MSLYLSIARCNLRYNLLPGILAALGVLIITPTLFGVTALDPLAAALPLELSIPFLGVFLLTPMYASEQEDSILATVRARKIPYLLICGIRIIMAISFMFIFIFGFVLLMFALECDVTTAHALGSFANAIFLGGLGILASSISGNVVIGYLLPTLYYVIDLMGGIKLTLFSMMRSGTMDGKVTIFTFGITFITASILCWHIRTSSK